MATIPPIFSPTEDQIPTVLAELINPELTLCDVAVRHKTGVQALALWMQRADIAERLNALSAATAFRARALALDQLPAAVGLLRQIMEEYAVLIRAPLREAPSLKAAHHRRAATDGARRAVNLLSRLARLLPPTIQPTPTPPTRLPPLPRAGEDRLERSDRQVRARVASPNAQPPAAETPPQRTSPEGEDRFERSEKQVGVRATHETPLTSAPDAEAEARRSLGSAPSATPSLKPRHLSLPVLSIKLPTRFSQTPPLHKLALAAPTHPP